MRHVNDVRWYHYVMELFYLADGESRFADSSEKPGSSRVRKSSQVQRVLDLACGSGQMLFQLAKRDFTVFGLDRSPEMVRRARQRLLARDLPALLWCGDMRTVSTTTRFDAVLCLYDSMNYCLEPEEIEQVLARVAGVVRPGGLFIFDVCTRKNCRTNFRNYIENDVFGDLSYSRRSFYHPQKHLQINEFIIRDERHGGPTLREEHVQRIYALEEIRSLAAIGDWQETGCFSGMSRRPGSERSDRVHFVLKRV